MKGLSVRAISILKEMPIFSKLSRRFHMLTTDAKPDPPRIEITGYTHNLDPHTVTSETNGIPKSAPVTPDPQVQQKNDVTPSEEKTSLSNGAIPIDVPPSATEENSDDTKYSTTPPKEHKKPNVKTKTKSKQSKYSQGTSVVNYNIVNSNGVKIGARTSYICNVNQFATKGAGAAPSASEESWSKSEIRQMPAEVERLCACTDEITLEDIFVVKTHIGHGWRDVARRLLYSDGQIEQFEENYRFRGISEVIYQIFLDWKQANTNSAEVGYLMNVLWACQEYDCAERLISFRKSST